MDQKCHLTKPSKLYLKHPLTQKVIKGHFKGVKSREGSIDYCKKEDTSYLSNLPEDEEDFELKIVSIAKNQSVNAAMKFFAEERPLLVRTQYGTSKKNLTLLVQNEFEIENQLTFETSKYPVEAFNYPPELDYWFHNLRHDKTLLIVGETGTGKTSGMIAYLQDKGLKSLVINKIKDLKRLKEGHDVLIYDDIPWNKYTAEERKLLVDKDDDKQIKIPYSIYVLRADIIKIILTNRPDEFLRGHPEVVKAIKRRLYTIELTQPMINYNFTQNIVNNNITINNNKTN